MGKISESQAKAIKQLAFNCLNAMDAYNKAKAYSEIVEARVRVYKSKTDFNDYIESITEK